MLEPRKGVTADCVRVYHFEASTSPQPLRSPQGIRTFASKAPQVVIEAF